MIKYGQVFQGSRHDIVSEVLRVCLLPWPVPLFCFPTTWSFSEKEKLFHSKNHPKKKSFKDSHLRAGQIIAQTKLEILTA